MVGPYPPKGSAITGGIEAVATYLANGLLRQPDLELHVVTLAEDGQVGTVVDGPLTRHQLPSSGRWKRPTLFLRERRAIAAKLRAMRPDVVHVQGQNFYAMGALAARMPTVVTLHGMLHKEAQIVDPRSTFPERVGKVLRGRFNSYFERLTLERARDLIIISPYVGESIRGKTTARLHRVDNPIDDRFFSLKKREVPGRLFFAGPIEPRKGLHLLLEAVAELPAESNAHLHIAGKTVDAGYANSLKSYVGEHGLEGRVRFLGLIDQAALLAQYAEASLIVMASQEESSPMLLQQAMAAGKATVAPRVGGIPFLVEDSVTGLVVEPNDAHAIAAALSRLLASDKERRAMGAAARRVAVERFAIDSVASRTVQVYHAAARTQGEAMSLSPARTKASQS